MKKINVGIIGFGLSGSVFHAPLITALEGFNLMAIASSQAELIARHYPKVTVHSTPESLISDTNIDLIIICTPTAQHFTLSKTALEHHKHVVVEKPFVLNSREGETLIELANQKGLLLSVYHNRRWDNDFIALQACLKKGILGEISTCELRFERFRPIVASHKWREQAAPGSGVLYDLGSHLIDQALCLFGWPNSIYAEIAIQRPAAVTVDYFHVLLEYGTVKVMLHSSSLVKRPGPRFLVHGTQGSFIKYGMDPQEQMTLYTLKPDYSATNIPFQKWNTNQIKTVFEVNGIDFEGEIDLPKGHYFEYYQQLYLALTEKLPAPVLATEALDTIKLIEYAMQSHQTGQKMRV